MIYVFQALEQQAGSSDDFQEIGNEGKEVIKRKYSMDDALEDSICDLYDLYVQVLSCVGNDLFRAFALFEKVTYYFLLVLFLWSRGWMKMQVRKQESFMQR